MVSNDLSSLISQIKSETETEKSKNKAYFVPINFKVEEIMKMINENSTNELVFDWHIYSDERTIKIKKLLKSLVRNGKSIKIDLRLNKIIDFELLGIQEYVNNNIDFSFSFGLQGYTYEEFLQLQKKLVAFLDDIESSMSPYEKYMIIYNKVRNFKPYAVVNNDNRDLASIINNKQQSCNFKYIFDNDYIDCLGYSLLLETLLNKVGIEASAFGFDVFDGKGNLLGSHARTLINLSDDKYDINGLFVSDPTWDKDDNNLKWSLLPVSSMRENIYGDCNETLLFDFEHDKELDNVISHLKTQHNETTRDTIIELINRIERSESEKLLLLNDDDFMEELEKYLHEKSNIIEYDKNK